MSVLGQAFWLKLSYYFLDILTVHSNGNSYCWYYKTPLLSLYLFLWLCLQHWKHCLAYSRCLINIHWLQEWATQYWESLVLSCVGILHISSHLIPTTLSPSPIRKLSLGNFLTITHHHRQGQNWNPSSYGSGAHACGHCTIMLFWMVSTSMSHYHGT